MDFDFPADDDPRRTEIRGCLTENPKPTPRELLARGLIVPHWPAPYGLSADPMHQIIIDEELARAGVKRPNNGIGIGWAAPTILLAGTEEQKERFLPGILCGEDFVCQMFSEPDAGSDLAALSTRAVRDCDEYVINGSISPALTLGGGTFAVQRNIVAETVLGLPSEPNVEKGMTWKRRGRGE